MIRVLLVLVALVSTLNPQPTRNAASLEGVATWYRYVPGQAAAGPRLRAMLGEWRGQSVAVTANGRRIVVTLTDWCACGGDRIIDLDRRDFAKLANPSVGVLRVSVSALPAPPDTATE